MNLRLRLSHIHQSSVNAEIITQDNDGASAAWYDSESRRHIDAYILQCRRKRVRTIHRKLYKKDENSS
jgi:hypothetical protein